MTETKFTFIDLFAGIGGFKMALSNKGGKCIGFSEVNKDAINTYCENYNIEPNKNLGDITKIENLPQHDLLTAGVPCQSWSIAGKNLGFDDDRGQLWNDTIYLLKKSQPKAFIFENVKGLADPRNKDSFYYILDKIKQAGYYIDYHVLNSFNYGVPQNRYRLFIIGFRDKGFLEKLKIPVSCEKRKSFSEILGVPIGNVPTEKPVQKDLFGNVQIIRGLNSSCTDNFNSFFQFNDLRNGNTTIHSWDLIETTKRQKEICLLLLKNRRKSQFGKQDGNPLSIEHFKTLDPTVKVKELKELVSLGIFREFEYVFEIKNHQESNLTENEMTLLSKQNNSKLYYDDLKTCRQLKVKKIKFDEELEKLKEKDIIKCAELRYEFKNKKISSGLFGINRIFLPTADAFPTLVASDTNDYITTTNIQATDIDVYKKDFLNKVFFPKNYRKITKEEACEIQGFPKDFILPESRARWMKLIGNSVSVPVIDALIQAIIKTGVFKNQEKETFDKKLHKYRKEAISKSQEIRVG